MWPNHPNWVDPFFPAALSARPDHPEAPGIKTILFILNARSFLYNLSVYPYFVSGGIFFCDSFVYYGIGSDKTTGPGHDNIANLLDIPDNHQASDINPANPANRLGISHLERFNAGLIYVSLLNRRPAFGRYVFDFWFVRR
jgi:hypothetical protein